MSEVLLALISQLNSSVFVLFLILAIVCYVVYKLGTWTEKFKFHDDKMVKFDDMNEKIISLKTKIDLIYQFTNPNAPTKSQSPISLTPVGLKISENIGATNIFEKHKEKLLNAVDSKCPKTAYDIQFVSFEVAKNDMINFLDEQDLLVVKNEAYNRGILVEDVMGVFGVLLRNEILKIKGIPLAEVDKDPLSQIN